MRSQNACQRLARELPGGMPNHFGWSCEQETVLTSRAVGEESRPMKSLAALLAVALSCSIGVLAAENPYPPGPDSKPQEGVPKGERIKGVFAESKIFPGTTRDYTVYIPTQLDKSKRAPFMVLQDGMCLDTNGTLYVATALGVQFCDQAGRVNGIIARPQNKWLANIVFGGANFDELYACCSDKVFKRKMNARGANSFQPSIKPKAPGL